MNPINEWLNLYLNLSKVYHYLFIWSDLTWCDSIRYDLTWFDLTFFIITVYYICLFELNKSNAMIKSSCMQLNLVTSRREEEAAILPPLEKKYINKYIDK